MVARQRPGLSFADRAGLLAAIVMPGVACVGIGEGIRPASGNRKLDEPIRLLEAEPMIDELDRVMTAYRTIGVKTPDVWGQNRLAKFRSEYVAGAVKSWA